MLGQGSLVALVAMLIQSVTPRLMQARIMALFWGAGLAPIALGQQQTYSTVQGRSDVRFPSLRLAA
ncbi:hypothetical protein [Celerinatantimonas yamalensis]|uniref:Uncharacterized protein n=1 Tax=Celerinatantimonas yamalensis TaxID=559956 RepID=A0ABW9GDD7_9GAMM